MDFEYLLWFLIFLVYIGLFVLKRMRSESKSDGRGGVSFEWKKKIDDFLSKAREEMRDASQNGGSNNTQCKSRQNQRLERSPEVLGPSWKTTSRKKLPLNRKYENQQNAQPKFRCCQPGLRKGHNRHIGWLVSVTGCVDTEWYGNDRCQQHGH